jgi:hypothetical protein
MNMQKTPKNKNSPSDNKSPIFIKKMTEPLENTFESSKDYAMTLQLLGNQFQTKKKSFASSQVSALNMKSSLPQCWNHQPSYPELVSQLQSLDQRKNWFTN